MSDRRDARKSNGKCGTKSHLTVVVYKKIDQIIINEEINSEI